MIFCLTRLEALSDTCSLFCGSYHENNQTTHYGRTFIETWHSVVPVVHPFIYLTQGGSGHGS